MSVTMKTGWKFLIVLSGILAMSFSAFARNEHGVCRMGSTTINDLTCYGPAILNGTTVKYELIVEGPLTLINANVQLVKAAGVTDIEKSVINHDLIVGNYLLLESSQVKGNVEVSGYRLNVKDSSISGDLIVNSTRRDIVLTLQGNSEISKNIEFKKSAGIVELHDNAKIIGKVINGTVKKM